ncbi:hypothetical protein [Arsenicicoccus dermatophilus]|uniref:hypothetical protein n=1 Tax=Arsenicicoccus dermatophilus TaxID=1076331 RepID=UPI003917344E
MTRQERLHRVRAKLQDAMAEQVCLDLDLPDDTTKGYCVGVGRRWALVRVAAPWPDGLVAVRLRHLERIRHEDHQSVERFAFEREGAWPPLPVEGIDLDRTEGLVTDLAERFPLLGIEVAGATDQLFVGAPVLLAEGTLMLQELTTEPAWEALSTWRLRDLTRLTVGDRYLSLMDELAPPRPQDPSPFAD